MNKVIKYILIFELILVLVFFAGLFYYEATHYEKQYSLSDINPNFQVNLSELGIVNNSSIRENLYTLTN